MEIINLRNPNALMVPEVYQLLERALGSVEFLAPGGLSSVAEDLMFYVNAEDHFLFLGVEDGAWKAVGMASLPNNRLFPYPTINLVYNEGSHDLVLELMDFALDIFLANGYTKIWAVNGSGHSDKAWERIFKHPRLKGKYLGGAYHFEVQ
jgi:hypothetical protein